MEKVKGFKYFIDGFEDLTKFSKGILALTNVKCSRSGTIVDIRTYEDSWNVSVVSMIDIESFIDSNVGKVASKEEIEIITVEFDDLNHSTQEYIDKKWDDDNEDSFIILDSRL